MPTAMLFPALLAAVVSAAPAEPPAAVPAPAQAAVKVAVPGLQGVNVPADKLAYFADHFGTQLGFTGMRVSLPADVATLLGYERQQQLLGCADDKCAQGAVNSLGVDAIVSGSIGKVESGYQVNLRVLNPAGGELLAQTASSVDGGEADLLRELGRVARRLAPDIFKGLGRQPDPALVVLPQQKGAALRKLWLVPAAVGVAAGAGGGVLLGLSWATHQRLSVGTPATQAEADQAQADLRSGRAMYTAGSVLVGVGAAAVVAGVAMLVAGKSMEEPADDGKQVLLVPTLNGAALVGRFP